MDLYIYYKVRREHAAGLVPRVLALQRRLGEEYGIVTGLKRRPEEKDGRQTWMEIYQAVPDGFDAALEQALAREGLQPLIDGRRNTEHFVDVSSCA
ncbi:MAG TPA: DUF4936 family protein [Noviherbaspirillum sp.]|uniref:DUF4936 family protein n=1 Tax=Noviherbaspirillum sp. TaxID=1926288 RepID=UPI002D30BC6D|nr:DUF4936 family protein [Noviherbaspirillum sp.]HYD95776.1 DUF4936 family protein [Noviherbaspirillum sp.]